MSPGSRDSKVWGSANLFALGLGIRSNPSSKVVIISKHAKLTYPLCGLPSALFCSTTRSHLALVTLFRACAPTRGLEVTECSAGGTLRSQPVRYTVARGRKKSCCAYNEARYELVFLLMLASLPPPTRLRGATQSPRKGAPRQESQRTTKIMPPYTSAFHLRTRPRPAPTHHAHRAPTHASALIIFLLARKARACTSAWSIGLCAIWACVSSNSSSRLALALSYCLVGNFS